MMNYDQEYRELLARIEDNISAADRGALAATRFLSPAEAFCAREYLTSRKLMKRVVLLGGYEGAERVRVVILPSYLDGSDKDPRELFCEYFRDEADELVRVVKFSGSGYRELSHRDYLGSILALGVERDALGDIITLDTRTAYAFASDSVAKLLLDSLERVANDKVDVELVTLDGDFIYQREFQCVSDTVASARLDCVAASLARLSRDKAQSLIESGACLLNYTEGSKCDKIVRSGDIITLRGYGKFIIRSIDQQTKKGRLRLFADKYV